MVNYSARLETKGIPYIKFQSGDHSFQARIFGKNKMKKKSMEPLDLTFEAVETYYLQLNLKTRVFDSQVDVQEITKSSADRIMPDLKLQENCKAE